jgi:DNA excision repair protein ERCC-2
MALTLSKLFMRTISQNPNENQTGISLWTIEDIEKAQAKQSAALELQEEEQVSMQVDDDEFGTIDDRLLAELDLDI